MNKSSKELSKKTWRARITLGEALKEIAELKKETKADGVLLQRKRDEIAELNLRHKLAVDTITLLATENAELKKRLSK